jgi:hypothetical protein
MDVTEDLKALRAAAKEAAQGPAPIRRVYNLPRTQVARLLRYQASERLASETMAARDLLEAALGDWEARQLRKDPRQT